MGDGYNAPEDDENSALEETKQNNLPRSKILEPNPDSVFLHRD